MKETALLLGNGISRLLFHDEIHNWNGELWGCNYVYLEWGGFLTRLTGHYEVLVKAAEERIKRGWTFDIYTGQFGRFKKDYDFGRQFTCPGEFRKDSGTTLVAQALEEDFHVLCCGYDFGGRDIYTLGLHTVDKTSWIRRWKAIGQRYGWNNIEFMGYDHKPFLMDPVSEERSYRDRYIRNQPHIPWKEYVALYNALYGTREVCDMRSDVRVMFKYNDATEKPGWVTFYKYDVAKVLEEKGLGKIIKDSTLKEEEGIVGITSGIPQDLDSLSKPALIEIAKLRGITSAKSKKDLITKLSALRDEAF